MDNLALKDYENPFDPKDRELIVGQIIKELRTKSGLKQKEIAEAIGATAGMISWWENGRSEPSMEMLVRMSYLFNVSLDVLLGRSIKTPPTKDGINSLIDDYDKQFDALMEKTTSSDELPEPMKQQMQELLSGMKTLMDITKTINNKRPEE